MNNMFTHGFLGLPFSIAARLDGPDEFYLTNRKTAFPWLHMFVTYDIVTDRYATGAIIGSLTNFRFPYGLSVEDP